MEISPETAAALLAWARISVPEGLSYERPQAAMVARVLGPRLTLGPLATLGALLYRGLERWKLLDELSPELGAQLERERMAVIAGDLALRQRVGEITRRLVDGGIGVILLKGACFSGLLYPDDAPRGVVDMDLLVRERDFDEACRVVAEIALQIPFPPRMRVTYEQLFERSFRTDGPVPLIIEVHRGLTHPHLFRIDEEDLWARSGPHPGYDSDSVRMLCREHTLIHLAVHAFRDLDLLRHGLLDSHELICRWWSQPLAEQLPEQLMDDARSMAARGALYFLLEACQRVLGTPVGEDTLARLRPPGWRRRAGAWALGVVPRRQLRHKGRGYRLAQLLSLETVPDHLAGPLRFQVEYLWTRAQDWRRARRGDVSEGSGC